MTPGSRHVLPALLPAPQFADWKAGPGRLDPIAAGAIRPARGRPHRYVLEAGPAGCLVEASSPEAMEWGRRTVAQMRGQAGRDGIGPGLAIRDYPSLDLRGVHVDLKCVPARFDWLLRWLDQLAAWKLNAVIVEYEDRFPYRSVPAVRHPAAAWTPDQVEEFARRAARLGLQVIPLVQSLGHLEYALVHPAHARLRERPDACSQACPLHPGTFELFTAMAGEVLALHPDARFFHVGADETAFLGACDACRARAAEVGKIGLYTDYLAKVCHWVAERDLRPMLWDDMVRREPERVRALPPPTVLVHWDYGATGTPVDETKGRIAMPDVGEGGPPRRRRRRAGGAPPYAAYRRAGRDVVLAACFTNGGLVPDVVGPAANSRFLAAEAAAHGCLGLISTSWACLFTPLSLSHHALAATADAAWNPLPSPNDMITTRRPSVAFDFDRRFCREFLGLPDDALLHAVRLLDVGAMFAPGGDVYPTLIAEPSFVDPSFLVGGAGYVALGAALFRPDWPKDPRVPEWGAVWRAKVDALKRTAERGRILAVLAEQAARAGQALDVLRAVAPRVERNRDYVDGLLAGAEVRRLRLRALLAELEGRPTAATGPEPIDRLTEFYARSLSPADARQLAAWLGVGLAAG